MQYTYVHSVGLWDFHKVILKIFNSKRTDLKSVFTKKKRKQQTTRDFKDKIAKVGKYKFAGPV